MTRIDFEKHPNKYRTWSAENQLWWMLFRTAVGGAFLDCDKVEFNSAKGKYMIYLDHTQSDEAKLFSINLLGRYDCFLAAKLSVFAINNTKVLVILAKSDEYYNSLKELCKAMGFELHRFTSLKDDKKVSDHDKNANTKWLKYLQEMANFFMQADKPSNWI